MGGEQTSISVAISHLQSLQPFVDLWKWTGTGKLRRGEGRAEGRSDGELKGTGYIRKIRRVLREHAVGN